MGGGWFAGPVAAHQRPRALKEKTSSKSVANEPSSIDCVPRRFWNHFIQALEPGSGEQMNVPPFTGLPSLPHVWKYGCSAVANDGSRKLGMRWMSLFRCAVLWQLMPLEFGVFGIGLPFTAMSLRPPSFGPERRPPQPSVCVA